MSVGIVLLILLGQVGLVAGQIFVKHGVNLTHHVPVPRLRSISAIAAGIGSMALWFFIWIGLLQKLELSYLFPFEGLSPILLVGSACVVLREKVTWRVWAGVLLVAIGTVLVGLSR